MIQEESQEGLVKETKTNSSTRTPLNAALILGARTFSRVVALFLVVAQANHLGSSGYGTFGTIVAYSALVGVIADLGLNTLYTREAARTRENISIYLSTLTIGKLPLIGLAIAALAIALNSAHLLNLLPLAAIMLALSGYSALYRNTFYALSKLNWEVGAIILEIITLAIGIFVGVRTQQGVAFFLLAYVASYIVSMTYTLIVLRALKIGSLELKFDKAIFLQWFKWTLPLAAGFILTNLYFRADIPILQHFRSLSEVGYYQLAYKPFEATQFIPLALQSVIYPVLSVYFANSSSKLENTYRKFYKVLLLLGWPLSISVFVLAYPMVSLLHLYPQSAPALQILGLAIVFMFVNSAFIAMLYSCNMQKRFALATGTAAIINISLNIIFVPIWGYIAASVITVITEFALALTCWLLIGHKKLPIFLQSWRILLCGSIMGTLLYMLPRRALLLELAGAGIVYLALVFLLRVFDNQEREVLGMLAKKLYSFRTRPADSNLA